MKTKKLTAKEERRARAKKKIEKRMNKKLLKEGRIKIDN